MLKKMKKTAFTQAIMLTTLICMAAFSLFAVNFSSIFFVLISGGIGLLAYAIRRMKAHSEVQK